MNLNNFCKTTYTKSILILIIAFCSFHFNFFKAVNNKWFVSHSIDSETLVFDGILNSLNQEKPYFLGNYQNKDKKVDAEKIRENFKNFQIGSDFKRYNSQYGLQVKLFGGLCSLGFCLLDFFYIITSFLMSIVIVIFYNLVKRDFSDLCAIISTSFLILSPWIIVFSKNLFWLSFTLYLPFLVSFYFSNKLYSKRVHYFFFISIFFAFLIKMLNGYEYVTTIFISTLVPLIYQFLEQRRSVFYLIKYSIVIFAIFVISFSVSIIMHSKSNSNNIQAHVLERFKYHTLSFDNSLLKNDTEVKNYISTSLKYFVFRDFLPWTSIGQAHLTSVDKTYIIKSFKSFNPKLLINNFSQLSKYAKIYLLNKILEITIFISILFYLILIFKKLKKSIKYSLLFAFLSSISWVIIGNKHSQLHLHINYIIWYIPFIPYAIISIISHRVKD